MLSIIANVGRVLITLCAWSVAAPSALADGPTQQYGYCSVSSSDQKTLYVSATFVTPWPVIVSLESRFLSFVVSKYGRSISRPQCFTFSTSAVAQTNRSIVLAPIPGVPFIETGWAPEVTTQPSAPPTSTPPSAPSPSTNASPAATTAAPIGAVPQTATYVICKSDFNTDRQRYYNPPVDVRGGGYSEWMASYQTYLEQTYRHTGTIVSCGKYPTQAAAQTDFDSWVTGARASPAPDIKGVPAPIVITNWKY
jgi:hypothetical protein